MSEEVTREALVGFMKGAGYGIKEPLATAVAEERVDQLLALFGEVTWGFTARFASDGEDPSYGKAQAGELYRQLFLLNDERAARIHVQHRQAEEDGRYPADDDPHGMHLTYRVARKTKLGKVVEITEYDA